MKGLTAIKVFFEKDGGRKVTLEEMKALTSDDRKELGKLACDELGEPYEEATK